MFNKGKFLTIEMYGFDGESHQAEAKIRETLEKMMPGVRFLILNFKVNPTDYNSESKEYIKIICSNRRLAGKLFEGLKALSLFKICYFGILPYDEIYCPADDELAK